jgi:hypothetical protein
MKQKRDGVYIWVTWLSKLMTGEQSCEWSPWLKANYEYYERVLDDFDSAAWRVEHTRLLRELRIERQKAGGHIYWEKQNSFKYKTQDGIAIAGVPDMVELVSKDHGIIYDAKTGQRSQSHQIQVILYMYLIPLAKPEWAGIVFNGAVQYKDGMSDIPASAVDASFKENFNYFIKVLASNEPPYKAPSESNCRFCDIHKQECPERIENI